MNAPRQTARPTSLIGAILFRPDPGSRLLRCRSSRPRPHRRRRGSSTGRCEAAYSPERAGPSAAILHGVRLRGILDDDEEMSIGNSEDGLHVRRLAVQVDWNNRLRSSGNSRFDARRVHVQRLNVDQHGPGARALNRSHGSHECVNRTVMTSSPEPTPAANNARCSAPVPELTPMACRAWQ